MNINELPDEVLVRILTFLPRSDRLESALTCRRWAQTVARAPPLLRDIWLVVGWNKMEEAETVFANSHRQYENLRLAGASIPLKFNSAFWTEVGPTLRKLELLRCPCSFGVFFSILQSCSNLESLEIRIDCEDNNWFKLSELPPAIILERIQKSMFNLRHLHLDSPTNADTLESLFILMPNISSIAFTCFGLKSDFSSRLPNILGASRRITMLDLHSSYSSLSNDECEQLLRISSASLRTLSFYRKDYVPGVLDALRDCSMLRDLTLHLPNDDIRLLQNILHNIPELESLSIQNYRNDRGVFRQEDLMAIFDLKKLRELRLCCDLVIDSDTLVPDAIVQNLSRMISLESLGVEFNPGIVDSTRFRILAGMPNLRELVISCGKQWDAEYLRIVLFDLGKLKTLEIHGGLDFQECTSLWPHQHAELERNISTPQDSVSSDRQGEQRFSFLEVLTIGGIPLCDDCLGCISSHHNRLKIVRLTQCHYITDAGLVTLFQREPRLDELVVHSDSLDGTFLESLGELCPRLRSLRVFTGGKISTQARERFKMRRPRVQCWFY